jgi:hypothetical protein
VQKLKSSILFTGILFGLGDGNIKIIDIYNGIVLRTIQEDFTLDNRFWFNLVDRYLVIVCTSRNSIAEYFIGDPSRPVLTGPELKLGELPGEKYMILDAHSHDGSRVGLKTTPVAVRSMDEHDHIKMLYFKVGASKFNRFEMVIDLYEYKPFTNFFLQTIVLTAPGFTGKQEVLSVVDTSTAAEMAANCGPKDAKGNPTGQPVLSCDYLIFHQPLVVTNLIDTSETKLACALNVFSNQVDASTKKPKSYFLPK